MAPWRSRRFGAVIGVALAAALAATACASSTDDAAGTSSSATTASTTPTTAPTTSAPATSSEPTTSTPTTTAAPALEFPPPGIPLDLEAGLSGVAPIVRLASADPYLLGVRDSSTLVRIDPASGEEATIELGLGSSVEGPIRYGIVGSTIVAVGGPGRNVVVEIDLATMTELDRFELPDDHGLPSSLPHPELWLTTLRGVRPVDLDTNTIGDPIDMRVDPVGLAVDDAVWVSLPQASAVARIDRSSGEVAEIRTEPGPTELVLSGSTLWVAHPATATVSRIDAEAARVIDVIPVDVADGGATATGVVGLRPSAAGLWAIVRYDGSTFRPVLVHIDGASGRIDAARSLHVDVTTQAARGDDLWVYVEAAGVLAPVPFDSFADGEPVDLRIGADVVNDDSETGDIGSEEDVGDVREAFERVIDPDVPTAELGLPAGRDQLLQLLAAQLQGTIRLQRIVVDGDDATTTFDVLSGETILLPSIEFDFTRDADGVWSLDPTTLCALAQAAGTDC